MYRKTHLRLSNRTRFILALTAGLLIGSSAYLLSLVLAPLSSLGDAGPHGTVAQKVANSKPQVQVDKLLIPNLNLDLTYTTGNAKVLNDGLWYRKPENGSPEKGGNFILSGHRFELGLTPGDTRRRSPLYHIDKLKVGDDLFVDYKGKRYAYKVSRIYDVDRTAVEIEAPGAKPKLTLYTCNIKGEKAGRVVVEASPVINE